MKEYLEKLFNHAVLTAPEARELFSVLLRDGTPASQIAAVLSAYRMRLPAISELIGFREAALAVCKKLNFKEFETIDVCGTGGDGKDTFNISTLCAVVLAACGVKVAKHGGGAVSSKCGSSNLLEALGYKFTADEGKLKSQLAKAGICFLHAPLFHPSFKNAAPIRKELGFKTVFNMLGPLVNPSSPAHQMIGVYSLDLVKLYAFLGQKLEKDLLIVHSLDGCDEISLTSEARVSHAGRDRIYSPADFGCEYLRYEDISEGESVERAVSIFKYILAGKGTAAQVSVVSANAGLGLFQLNARRGKSATLKDCVSEAKEAIQSGKARETFQQALELSAA